MCSVFSYPPSRIGESKRGSIMFAIAVTDNEWFENIRSSKYRDVNFWTPTPWGVKSVKMGDRWYFMRKAPVRLIGGYGVVVRYHDLPIQDAWSLYRQRNGVISEADLVAKIDSIASKRSEKYRRTPNPIIGCVELKDVVTFDDLSHIDLSTTLHEFPANVVKFKMFGKVDQLATRF